MSLFDFFRPSGPKIDLSRVAHIKVKMKNGQDMLVICSFGSPLSIAYPNGRIFYVATKKYLGAIRTLAEREYILEKFLEESSTLDEVIEKIKEVERLPQRF